MNAKRHLTVRKLPADLAKALERDKKRRGTSLNQTVIELLAQSLGIDPSAERSNGLKRLAGTWTDRQLKSSTKAISTTESIDEELWR